jgi:NAD(P)-dependent dehydrogenase (short-subunit alcohol dehydrogenase family)
MGSWTAADIPDQAGRAVFITGANSGLGLRSAEALAARGATVLMGCRSAERGAAALTRVAAVASGPAPAVVPLDLADLGSVKDAAADVAGRTPALDVLMNNAGIMAVPLGRTADGFEMQFGTNHLGHYALTGHLLPLLLASPHGGRVVTTSSGVHKSARNSWDDPNYESTTYHRWRAYGQSKLANLLFMRELGRRAAGAGTRLTSTAAHPGYAATHLQGASAEATGLWPVRKLLGAAMVVGNGLFAQSDTAGARPQLYAATMADVGSGDYFGPDGLGEMRGAPTRVGMSAAAQDDGAARRVWALSEELTGVVYDWGAPPPAG